MKRSGQRREDLGLLAGGGGDYGKRREGEEEGKKARQGLRSPHHLPPEVVSRCAIGRPGKLKLLIYRHRHQSIAEVRPSHRGDGLDGGAEAGTWTAESDCLAL